MYGAIIGDIVGSRWEFNPTNEYDFEWLSKENGFTDDTICTVAVADVLLKGRDFGESIHDWCNRYPHPMGGYGGRFAQWVHSDNPLPYNSFGNGAAMRVSPVAHWYNTLDEVLDAAASTALPSHNHAMLYIPKAKWMEAVYHGDFWRFINIRETATNTSNLSEMQAYTMMDRNTFGYMVYDAVNERTAMTDAYYNVDENALNNCWQILKKDGNDYLYNIGASKYATFNPDGQMILTEHPIAINLENGKDGVIIGNNAQKQWAFVLNNKVQAKDVIIDGVPTIGFVPDAPNQ